MAQKNDRQDEQEQRLTYEQAVETLEAIVDRIERGEVGLEDAIAEYERGMKLVAHCREILERAEQRIEELERGPSGAGDREASDADSGESGAE